MNLRGISVPGENARAHWYKPGFLISILALAPWASNVVFADYQVFFIHTGSYFSFEASHIVPECNVGHGFLQPGSGNGARFDFWIAPDGVVDGSGAEGGGGASINDPNYASPGNDIFLGSLVISEDGVDQYERGTAFDIDSFASLASSNGANFSGPGIANGTAVAYGRVFETAIPQAGDWYYVGQPELLRDVANPIIPPNIATIGRAEGIRGADPIDGTPFSHEVVDETAISTTSSTSSSSTSSTSSTSTTSAPLKDFGDAPSPYPTLEANNGPRHSNYGPTLGNNRDAESDGDPSTAGDGDDTSGIDDEDGISFNSDLRVGQLGATMSVFVSNAPHGAKLDGWVDFNADGSWGGPFEKVSLSAPVQNGVNTISFDVPSWAVAGSKMGRFRLSTAGSLGPQGFVSDGEVEDHLLELNSPIPGSGRFVANDIITASGDINSISAADMEGDGDMDVVVASNGEIAWHKNDGRQNFSTHVICTFDGGVGSIFAADIDGDGDKDVVSASPGDNIVAWHENEGGHLFVTHLMGTAVGGANSVYAADMDGDGDLDVLASSSDVSDILWFENDGNQNFNPQVISTSNYRVHSLFAVDMEKDGDLDILCLSASSKWMFLFQNDGSQNFSLKLISTEGYKFNSIFPADMDADGDMDVISSYVEHYRGYSKIAWHRDDGGKRYSTQVISAPVAGTHSIIAIDMDGDGDMDVLSALTTYNKIVWFENVGSQKFIAREIGSSTDLPRSTFAADVDADGDMDMLSASSKDDRIVWYEQVFTSTTTSSTSSTSTSTATSTTSTTHGALILHYTFDADEDEIIIDQSGNGHQGYLIGAECIAEGAVGGSCRFDGSNDFIFVPDYDGLDTSVITVSAWVKVETSGRRLDVLSNHSVTDGSGWMVSFHSPGDFRFRAGNGIWPSLAVRTPDRYDEGWYHITAINSETRAIIYIDGEVTVVGPGTSIKMNDLPLYLGRNCFNGENYFGGLMDDVRIYGRALSTREIRDLYFLGMPTPDIVANGLDGPLEISQADSLRLDASLDPGILAEVDADWWGIAETPMGMFYYDIDDHSWIPGLAPSYQGPLFVLDSFKIKSLQDLPVGLFRAHFGVDPIMNGLLDLDELYIDSIEINVSE